jgi:hypothetical protein
MKMLQRIIYQLTLQIGIRAGRNEKIREDQRRTKKLVPSYCICNFTRLLLATEENDRLGEMLRYFEARIPL